MTDPSVPGVVAYTDGACRGNPGPGGYGVVLTMDGHRRELSGGFARTTNNRMELLAAIRALEVLTRKCRITIHTDSQYVVQGINEGWAVRWRSKGWRTAPGRRAKNHDLWTDLLRLVETHEVTFSWVKGHAGIEENERTDQLAETAACGTNLPPDEGFERLRSEPESAPLTEGEPCFACGHSLVKRAGLNRIKPGQATYFEWHLQCPVCHRTYMVEAARRTVETTPTLPI